MYINVLHLELIVHAINNKFEVPRHLQIPQTPVLQLEKWGETFLQVRVPCDSNVPQYQKRNDPVNQDWKQSARFPLCNSPEKPSRDFTSLQTYPTYEVEFSEEPEPTREASTTFSNKPAFIQSVTLYLPKSKTKFRHCHFSSSSCDTFLVPDTLCTSNSGGDINLQSIAEESKPCIIFLRVSTAEESKHREGTLNKTQTLYHLLKGFHGQGIYHDKYGISIHEHLILQPGGKKIMQSPRAPF